MIYILFILKITLFNNIKFYIIELIISKPQNATYSIYL